MKKITIVYVGILLILSILTVSKADATLNVVNITSGSSSSGLHENAQFIVKVIKYEPYPVNAGDWFDLWVKVENIGQDDAKNARFEIVPSYPFEANYSLVKEFGIIPGTVTARRDSQQNGESQTQTNQVIMKFRIKAADNAPEGESIIGFKSYADSISGQYSYDLPIEVGKTKTDFDVVMQDSTATGTSFAIANTGENTATAVTVFIEQQDNLEVSGSRYTIIGNLARGDFTTVTFPIIQNKNVKEIKILVTYTDAAGVRNKAEKTVSVNFGSRVTPTSTTGNRTQSSSSSTKYIYLVIGIIIGIAILPGYRKLRRKKK